MTASAAANLAAALVDQHAGTGTARVALRVLGAGDVTYDDLADRSRRVATVLAELDVAPGDTVATLLPRGEPLVSTLVGAWRHGAVTCSLFTAYGPDPVVERLRRAGARVLVTTPGLYRRKLAARRAELPLLRHVLVVDDARGTPTPDRDTVALDPLLRTAPPTAVLPVAVDATTPAFVHFTSGTTGPPKAAVHTHGAVVQQLASARAALDLRGTDVYWCTADPGWITGIVYGVIAPLAAGVTSIVDPSAADVDRWPETLRAERVNIWYTAPTALRLLRHGAPSPTAYPDLRVVATVGEPLDADLARWTAATFGVAVRDTWWQTETGAIMIGHRDAAEPLGTMGHALAGVDAAVLRRRADGRAVVRAGHVEPVDAGQLDEPGEPGELALRAPWPSMFTAYLHDDERYAACFVDGWYLTGDVVRRDADGRFTFVGRADDVIKSAGHLVSPVEVEQVLLAHPAVAEVGVVGAPDPVAGEVVWAYVRLAPGAPPPDDALALELIGHARAHLGAALAPRSIVFVPSLPTTESGKIRRRALRAAAAQEVVPC